MPRVLVTHNQQLKVGANKPEISDFQFNCAYLADEDMAQLTCYNSLLHIDTGYIHTRDELSDTKYIR